MRAGKNEAVGTSGESEVLAEFQRLGWAGVIDARHDTGTDLYLRPRDSRRYELGAVMGAQVKTGPHFFKRKVRDEAGEVVGWWFVDDDREHIDYWLRHALPHVLILRDQEARVSYWVHITPDAVVSTGRGAKVLVPKSQTVDEVHDETLTDIALMQLPSPVWDGSVWTGAANLSSVDKVRHALIAPRLVAPHPNLKPESVSGIEALAMQVLIREELDRTLYPESQRFLDSNNRSKSPWRGLSLDLARQSDDWCWRATAALHLWLYKDEDAEIFDLVSHAKGARERAASTVLACVVYFDRNDPDAALAVLEDSLIMDDYTPVDYAWLQAQKARALLEIGKQEQAFDLAMKTQRIYKEVPHDVTASAISGACAQVAFRATAWMKGDIESLIQRNDNPATWWRSQVLSYGFSSHLSEAFRSWAQDRSIRFGFTDRAHRKLLSAALLASCVADQDGWRNAKKMLGEHLLISSSSENSTGRITDCLNTLRLAGSSKELRLAVRRIVDDGPSSAVTTAALNVDPSRSTRTTALTDLELLTQAGDVLTPEQADKICFWALETLRDQATYCARTSPTFIVQYKLIDLLISIVRVLGKKALRSVINYLLNMPEVTDDGTAQTLARLVHSIPEEVWTEDERRRASLRAVHDAPFLREAYLAIAAREVEAVQEEIINRARSGDLLVLDAVNDIRTLPVDAVDALVKRIEKKIDTLIAEARRGSYSLGGIDPAYALVLINIWHPQQARWGIIKTLLSSREVELWQKEKTLQLLALRGSELSLPVKQELLSPIEDLRVVPPREEFGQKIDGRGVAAEAAAALSDENRRRQLISELIAGDSVQRASAARIIERFIDPNHSGTLIALAGDLDLGVRNAAIGALSKLISISEAKSEIVDYVADALLKSGRRLGLVIAHRLASQSPPSEEASKLLDLVRQHPSATVRRVVDSI